MIRQRLWSLQARFSPHLFVAPFVILFGIFLLYPLLNSIFLSLYQYATPTTSRFVGMGNYRYILTDPLFWRAVRNTVIFTAAILCIQIPASLGLALLLNHPGVRCRNLFRFAFFASHLVGHVFVAVIFRVLLAPRHGLMPVLMGMVRPELINLNWLHDAFWGRVAIVLAILWINIGWGMIYFLAALQNVDPELYEAAEVDGAGPWHRFWHVTFPGIKPVLLFLMVVCTISSFQLFELPYMLYENSTGPGQSGLTVVMYLYMMGFEWGDIGAASAVGWILACMIFGVSLLQVRLSRANHD